MCVIVQQCLASQQEGAWSDPQALCAFWSLQVEIMCSCECEYVYDCIYVLDLQGCTTLTLCHLGLDCSVTLHK